MLGASDGVSFVVWSLDGTRIFSLSGDDKLRCWDAENFVEVDPFQA